MRRTILLVVVGVLVLLSAAPAMAASRTEIFRDCSDDGQLEGDYTRAELRDARKNLPTDLREYSDCADALQSAEQPTGGSGPDGGSETSGGSGSGGPGGRDGSRSLVPQSEADQEALQGSRDAGKQPLSIGEEAITPARSGDSDGGGLPAALVVSLILLGLAALALAVPQVRRRINLPFLPQRS